MTTPYQPHRFAIDTYSYTLRWTARDCLLRLARMGFREFELQMYPGHLWPAEIDGPGRRDLRAFLADQDLTVATLNMPNIDLNIAAATREMREMTLGILHRVIELAGDLGVEAVVIGPGKANPLLPMPREQLMANLYAGLDQIVPLAESCGTSLLLENMPFAFLPGMQELLDAIDAYGDDRIGVVFDVANSHFVGEDPCAAIRACGTRLRAVHVSDTGRAAYRHDVIGLGTVDFQPLPAVLSEVGFTRRPILEVIAADADAGIESSARQLCSMGWERIHHSH